jgi:glyoxylase-like metal-dependent hydrolase (beta-lactamase superfamily II)
MTTTTATAISPDSGEHWSAPGAWPVAEGVWRIPLPLPMDGLKAVNVYVLRGDDGLSLIDGGWAITEGRAALEAGLAELGAGFGDIRRFLVTHVHRDHYTLASVLGGEYGATLALGIGDRGTLEGLNSREAFADTTVRQLRRAGALELAERMAAIQLPAPEPAHWRYPDQWLEGELRLDVAGRTLDAVPTPGHTQGHYVFADEAGGVLFAGDHVLPTITPSIGLEGDPGPLPLGDFLASLARMRALPDLRVLPAHGPVGVSSHARVEELLAHHETRLGLSLAALRGGATTAVAVAGELPWTRHAHAFASLDLFNAALAATETMAHLDVLVARGVAVRADEGGTTTYAVADAPV